MDTRARISNFCRICASETSPSFRLNIFENEGTLKQLNLKIATCLPIKVHENDNLPKVVCTACVNKLDLFHELRNISLTSESYLQELLQEQIESVFIKEERLSPVLHENELSRVNSLQCSPDVKLEDVDVEHSKINEQKSSQEQENIQEIASENVKQSSTSLEPSHFSTTGTHFLTNLSPDSSQNKAIDQPKKTKRSRSKATTSTEQLDSLPNQETPLIVPTSNQHQPPHATYQESALNEPAMTIFQCRYCKMLFTTKKASQEHITSVHKKIHKCNVCNESFRSSDTLAIHKQKYIQQMIEEQAKDQKHKCVECGKGFRFLNKLQTHMACHSDDRPFKCKYCEKTFKTAVARRACGRTHEKQWTYVCSYCSKGFIDKTHFIYHERKEHTGEKPFQCLQCDAKFILKYGLENHMISAHSTEPKQLYKCDICDKMYTSETNLKLHKKIHNIPLEERKKVKCTICDAVFTSKSYLKRHNLCAHSDARPFKCDNCDKSYNTKNGLKIHLLTHSGVKQFVCDICGAAFALGNSLRVHNRIHTGERPYKCDVCELQFTQSSSLKAHRKRHDKRELVKRSSKEDT